jgi:hypothetical protein
MCSNAALRKSVILVENFDAGRHIRSTDFDHSLSGGHWRDGLGIDNRLGQFG